MKLNKIFAMAAAGLFMVSCSNDKEVVTFNTLPDATVEMGEPTVTVKENRGLFSVPINVYGERNGCVTVTVAVKEMGENPAIEDADFFITTKTVNIPAHVDAFNVEIATHNSPDADPDKTFELEIVDVKHATQAGRLFTTVTIIDKGIAPAADAIPNVWDASAETDDNGTTVEWRSSMTLIPEGTPNDNGDGVSQYPVLKFSDWLGESFMTCPVQYRYDYKENWADFYIPYGTVIAEGVNFTDLGAADLVVVSETGNPDGELKGTWNDDFTGFSFSGNTLIWIYQNGKKTQYYYKQMNNVSLKVAE